MLKQLNYGICTFSPRNWLLPLLVEPLFLAAFALGSVF